MDLYAGRVRAGRHHKLGFQARAFAAVNHVDARIEIAITNRPERGDVAMPKRWASYQEISSPG